jgi:hypothetical protein
VRLGAWRCPPMIAAWWHQNYRDIWSEQGCQMDDIFSYQILGKFRRALEWKNVTILYCHF